MPKGLTRYRLSIAVFDEIPRMWLALAELLEHGFSPDQFCLAGLPPALVKLEVPPQLDRTAAGILSQFMSTGRLTVTLDGCTEIETRCGAHMSGLFAPAKSKTAGFSWMQNELRSKLSAHAVNGDVIVLVSAMNSEQHTAGAHALLHHGQHALQTHEFSLDR